jgi:3-phenylpropionate/trans-cinnamate dioxygenase ferredoxin subunit
MAEVKITATKNGPYKVTGEFDIFYEDQRLPAKTPAFLCRCGASSTKPFCDGTHSQIGFQAAAELVPGSKE